MVQNSNYHCHSLYSDGKDKPVNYIKKAIKLGIETMGFSEHAPLPFETFWNMKANKIEAYITEIKDFKNQFKDIIDIYCGLEIDYFPTYQKEILAASKTDLLDYTIGSLHFLGFKANGEPWNTDSTAEEFEVGAREVFGNNGKRLVESYYTETIAMIETMKPTIIGHFDKIKMFNERSRYFDENSDYYKNAVIEAMKKAKNHNTIIEFNTRGLYKHPSHLPYPSHWILEKMHEMKIPVTINSDCHHPDEIINKFTEARQMLKIAGFKSQAQMRKGKWVEVEI
jgi:histidinol-phosphatase (PHP family)